MPACREVIVVGAGIVGLSTAWFLQSYGMSVTVIDQGHVGAGASWGNAGWVTPALVAPLPEPAMIRYGVRAALAPSGPVSVDPWPTPQLIGFLASFLAHCTPQRWRGAMAALAPFAQAATDAFDELSVGGVTATVSEAKPMIAAFRRAPERAVIIEELMTAQRLGAAVDFATMSGDEARAVEPTIARSLEAAVQINGQRYLDPGRYILSLADQVLSRGGVIKTECPAAALEAASDKTIVVTGTGEAITADAIVVANGAWLAGMRSRLGIRPRLCAGRGYSFTVAMKRPISGPLYFPSQRIACTPLADSRLRIAGVMEFKAVDAPLDPRRVRAIATAARNLLDIDVSARHEEWVGARPVTADGLPLIGATAVPGVFVAGGHGMWGVTLGPATGKHLAQLMATGRPSPLLAPFDPRRRP